MRVDERAETSSAGHRRRRAVAKVGTVPTAALSVPGTVQGRTDVKRETQ